jgi:hypothetical protein
MPTEISTEFATETQTDDTTTDTSTSPFQSPSPSPTPSPTQSPIPSRSRAPSQASPLRKYSQSPPPLIMEGKNLCVSSSLPLSHNFFLDDDLGNLKAQLEQLKKENEELGCFQSQVFEEFTK